MRCTSLPSPDRVTTLTIDKEMVPEMMRGQSSCCKSGMRLREVDAACRRAAARESSGSHRWLSHTSGRQLAIKVYLGVSR